MRTCVACGRGVPLLAAVCPTCGTRADGASLRAARAWVGRFRQGTEERVGAFALVTGVMGVTLAWAGWAFGAGAVFFPMAVVLLMLSAIALYVVLHAWVVS